VSTRPSGPRRCFLGHVKAILSPSKAQSYPTPSTFTAWQLAQSPTLNQYFNCSAHRGQIGSQMRFFVEQYFAAAKLLREQAELLLGAEREKRIKSSNGFLACAALAARERGGISFSYFDWGSLTPDWNTIDDQIARLKPPYVDGPSLVPSCSPAF
jgi:hypothetical protein